MDILLLFLYIKLVHWLIIHNEYEAPLTLSLMLWSKTIYHENSYMEWGHFVLKIRLFVKLADKLVVD